MISIALLNIGTELLRGRTVNTNAAEIGVMLLDAGFSLDRTEVIHDDGPVIKAAMLRLLDLHDVVLVTGGLGPTKDDITKTTLLEIFGGELVQDQAMYDQMAQFVERMGREMNDLNKLQSMVPSSCKVLHNSMGSAPGMLYERDGKLLAAMPGVPFEMRHLIKDRVIPILKEKFPPEQMLKRILRTYGIAESDLAEQMALYEDHFLPGLDIAYLPSFDGTKMELKLRTVASESAQKDKELGELHVFLAEKLAKWVYATQDLTADTLLANWLKETGTTFCTAESCTGGAISAKIVRHSGVSSVHKGGVIAYWPETKEEVLGVPVSVIDEFGVVSEETAIAMAEGARKLLGTDAALSITGIAEGDIRGPESERPQVWIAFAGPHGTVTKHLNFFHSREVNIERATMGAIVFAYQQLAGQAY